MKKFSLLCMAALLAAGGAYAHRTATPSKAMTINGRTFKVGGPAFKNAAARQARTVRPVVGPDVITEADLPPGSVAQEYSKTSGGYYYYGGYNSYQDAAQAATIWWAGDDAYIYNILSYKETDSFIKGTRSGDKLTVPLGQYVAKETEFGIKLGLLMTIITVGENPDWDDDYDEEDKMVTYIDFVLSDDYDDVVYTIDSKGGLTLQMPELPDGYNPPDDGFEHPNPADYNVPPYCLGFYYTDDDLWTGDGDFFQSYEEFNYPLVTAPEDADYKYYTYLNGYDQGVLVNVARVDNTLYFKGLSAFAPESVFTAQISADGKQAWVKQNQYIGKSDDGYYNLLTKTVVTDRFGNSDLAAENVEARMNISYDGDGNITSFALDGQNNVLEFNYADDFYDPYDQFPGITLKYQKSLEGVPLPPSGAYFEDHSQWLGAFWLFFYMDQFSEEGNMLDVNELYYRIYVNGKPFTFEQHDGLDLKGDFVTMYQGVTQPTDLIGYTFYNGSSLFYDEYHLYYVAFFDVEGFETVGVQSVYTYGGREECSEIVTVDVSGVKDVTVDDGSRPVYYDLQGRKVANPGRGLYIKVEGGKASKVVL